MLDVSTDKESLSKTANRLSNIENTLKYSLIFLGVAGWGVVFLLLSSSFDSAYRSNNYLSPDLAYNHTRYTVWYHSEGKIRELRSILMQHDVSSDRDKAVLRQVIESMLIKRTDVYANELNQLRTPIDHIGNYYLTVFKFDEFLDSVMQISLDESHNIDEKMIAVTEVMFVYQTEANKILKKALIDAANGEG